MKEVTYEDWLKNPTPRVMWIWDDESSRKKRKVLYILSEEYVTRFRVIALDEDACAVHRYAHCAEIEEPKTRRMTNKELSRWLREKSTREFKYCSSLFSYVYSTYTYDENEEEEEVRKDVVIREDDGEWKEPNIVEVEE